MDDRDMASEEHRRCESRNSSQSKAVDTEMPEARRPGAEGKSKPRATTTAPSLLNRSIFNLGNPTVFALLFYTITNDNNENNSNINGNDDNNKDRDNDDNTDEKSDNHYNRDRNENDISTALLLQGMDSFSGYQFNPNGELSFASSVCVDIIIRPAAMDYSMCIVTISRTIVRFWCPQIKAAK
jgi:hypothetical protein